MKTLMIVFAVALGSITTSQAKADTQVIGDYIRNSSGDVARLNLKEAKAACERRHSRLPTIREFAKEAEKYDGKLLERSEFQAGQIPRWYHEEDFIDYAERTLKKNEMGDRFYYTGAQYAPPKDGADRFLVWSSSAPYLHILGVTAFLFDEVYGDISDEFIFVRIAARCIVSE